VAQFLSHKRDVLILIGGCGPSAWSKWLHALSTMDTVRQTHLSQSDDVSNHIVSTKERKNLRWTTSHSVGLLHAHHPGLIQRYISSWNGIWTNGADNKAYRRVNTTACALVSYRRQTSVSVSRRTLLHNIRRQRRRCFDNIKVNITPRERFIQGFGGETWGEEYNRKTYAQMGENIKMDFQAVGSGAWTGLMWLTVGTSGGLVWMRQWTFGFHKMGGISWLTEKRLASQEGLLFCGLTYLYIYIFIYLFCSIWTLFELFCPISV